MFYVTSMYCKVTEKTTRPTNNVRLTKQDIEELRESYRVEQLRKVSKKKGFKAIRDEFELKFSGSSEPEL